MYQIITQSMFHDAFHYAGRGKQFSYDALNALYDYLEDATDDYNLDVIGLCCEYTELTWNEVVEQYDLGIDPKEIEEIENELNNKTTVIWCDKENVLFQQF